MKKSDKIINVTCEGKTTLRINDIKGLQGNLKELSKDNYKKLKQSLLEHGFAFPVNLARIKGKPYGILDAHQRIKTVIQMCSKEGYCLLDIKGKLTDKIPVTFTDVKSKKEAGELILQAISQYGKVTEEGLYEFVNDFSIDINSLETFDLPDFDIDRFIESYAPEDVNNETEDEIPEEVKSISKLGDLWQLGEHRLLCGDSTKKEDVERLMDGKKADAIITDPPYNLNFRYNSYDDKKSVSEYKTMLQKSIINTNIKNKIITIGKQNIKLWFEIADVCDVGIWYCKNKMTGGRISNLSKWEPIIFIGKYDRNTRPNDIFEFTNERQAETGDHSCPKTVKLFKELLIYCKKTIYDPFIGSGTTLIACEKTNRICYGMELDPHYCDVICQRYVDYSGNTELIRNGKPYKLKKSALAKL